MLAYWTVCDSPADVLRLKLLLPAYVATSVLVPVIVSVSKHWPTATVFVQLTVPSLTVTLPTGVPAPGAVTATVYLTVTDVLTGDGSGVSEVMVVVVLAGFTVCGSPADVLELKLLLPAYVATSVLLPAVVNVSEH